MALLDPCPDCSQCPPDANLSVSPSILHWSSAIPRIQVELCTSSWCPPPPALQSLSIVHGNPGSVPPALLSERHHTVSIHPSVRLSVHAIRQSRTSPSSPPSLLWSSQPQEPLPAPKWDTVPSKGKLRQVAAHPGGGGGSQPLSQPHRTTQDCILPPPNSQHRALPTAFGWGSNWS